MTAEQFRAEFAAIREALADLRRDLDNLYAEFAIIRDGDRWPD